MKTILDITDFAGTLYELPTSDLTTARAELILHDVEVNLFRRIMGDDSYSKLSELITPVAEGTTLDPTLHDEINNFWAGVDYYTVDGERILYEEGFKGAVMAMAWFEIMRDFHQFTTDGGILDANYENSKVSANAFQVLKRMQNRAVNLYEQAAVYIQYRMIDQLEMVTFDKFIHTRLIDITMI